MVPNAVVEALPASCIILRSYLDLMVGLDAARSPEPVLPAASSGATTAELVRELRLTVREMPGAMTELQRSMAALDGPASLATEQLVGQSIVVVYLAWLRLSHHCDVLTSRDLSPLSRRLVSGARAVAPSIRATADLATMVLAARSRLVPSPVAVRHRRAHR